MWLAICAALPSCALAYEQNAPGSMIDPDRYLGLAADRRAHEVGDTLTVVVTETARATASAGTDADNDVRFAGSVQTKRSSHAIGLGLSGSDTGTGATSRAGTLQAQLAVRVVRIEGDGMLRIHGEQVVVINGEKQHFSLTGLVRAQDISATNTILSNRISEASIEFAGAGDVSSAQRRSLIYRITKWLGLI
jgi:flagellar L-ring protein precursor FlgH